MVHLWVSWPWDCPTLAPAKAMENSMQRWMHFMLHVFDTSIYKKSFVSLFTATPFCQLLVHINITSSTKGSWEASVMVNVNNLSADRLCASLVATQLMLTNSDDLSAEKTQCFTSFGKLRYNDKITEFTCIVHGLSLSLSYESLKGITNMLLLQSKRNQVTFLEKKMNYHFEWSRVMISL